MIRPSSFAQPLTFWLRIVASLIIGGALLGFALARVSMEEARTVVAMIEWRWIAMAMGLYMLALFCRVVRWWTILNWSVRARLGQVATALLVGYAMNVLLPARLGELLRVDFCRREYGIPRSVAFGTVLVERLSDGIIVLVALLIGLMAVRAGAATQDMLYILLISGGLLFGSCGSALYLLGSDWAARQIEKLPRFRGRLSAFHASIRLVRRLRMIVVMLESVVVWCFDGGALYGVLLACGIGLDFAGMCLVVGIVSLSTLLPAPPGFIGTMQFAFVLPAAIFDYSPTQGLIAASANQLFLLLPMAICGTGLYLLRLLRRQRIEAARFGNPRS